MTSAGVNMEGGEFVLIDVWKLYKTITTEVSEVLEGGLDENPKI